MFVNLSLDVETEAARSSMFFPQRVSDIAKIHIQAVGL